MVGTSQVALEVNSPPASAKDSGLIPRSGKSPGEGNGNPLQYLCLGNPMDRGAWWAIVCGDAKRTQLITHRARMLTLGLRLVLT